MGDAGALPSNHVTGFTRDDDGGVRIVTAADELTLEAGASPAKPRLAPGPDGLPSVAAYDGQGRLWVGTRDRGLRIGDDAWTELRLNGRSLPRHITALWFEDDRTLWVGTVTEGALRLDLGGAS
jgi:ligand-binding sensor domain-containing protein